MQDANAAHTSGYGPELSAEQSEDKLLGGEAKKLYQSITGSLLYLAQCTRYDLCYAINQLTRACSKPAEIHMTAAKHALRYLRGTTDLPIVYKRGKFRMVSYTDASFGANHDNRKSMTGYLLFLGQGLISFGSKKQSLTAQSTVESELQALSYGAREAVYLFNFLMELRFKTFSSVPINSDSTGALSMAGNAMFSSRTKHIALRFSGSSSHGSSSRGTRSLSTISQLNRCWRTLRLSTCRSRDSASCYSRSKISPAEEETNLGLTKETVSGSQEPTKRTLLSLSG